MELREALGVEVDLTTTSSLTRDERERILESSASL
jgi:predicted nucleotidyltransferase